MKGLAYWTNGFKQFTSNKGPIIFPNDIKGQTFRIMQSQVLKSQFDQLDAKSIQQAFDITFNPYNPERLMRRKHIIKYLFKEIL